MSTAERLLATIHEAAAVDDLALAARREYGELLAARGDPFGRFIALALARRDDHGAPTPEERRLVWEHWREWVGAPGPLLDWSGSQFLHGFWHACSGFSYEQFPFRGNVAEIANAPTWNTVRKLYAREFVPVPFLSAILSGPLHRSVRDVTVQTATQLAALAAWSGPPLALRSLRFADDRKADAPLATSFPGLPRLGRFIAGLSADTMGDWINTSKWLLGGICGDRGDVHTLEVSVSGRVVIRDDPLPWILELPNRTRSPALRVLELYCDWMQRVVFERDDDGAWTRIRARWLPSWHQLTFAASDMEKFARFVMRLPREGHELIIEVPAMNTEPAAAESLARLAEGAGARVERPAYWDDAWDAICPIDPNF